MKTCKVCQLEKSYDKFYFRKDILQHMTLCKKCYAHNQKKSREKAGYHRIWAQTTIAQHKYRQISCLFSADQLEDRAKRTNNCDLCERQLSWSFGKGSIKEDSPTLDNMNLDSNLSLNDIMIICSKCNLTKSNRSFNEFISYCSKIANKFNIKVV